MSTDALGKDPAITTSDLTHRIYRKYDTSEDAITNKYIVATQVRPYGAHGDSTADAVVVGNWPSVGYEVQGFEVKISRADALNDLKSPGKCKPTKQYCHRWWLVVASQSMVKDGELPEDWGLMVAHGNGLKVIKKAPLLEPIPLSVQFMSGVMRANKREHVPMDLHQQYIQDNNRAIAAQHKAEFADLLHFVKFIHEAFGIQLKQNKRWDYKSQKDIKEWVAGVRGDYRDYTPADLKVLIEAALTKDLHQVDQELKRAYINASNALEKLDRYKAVRGY